MEAEAKELVAIERASRYIPAIMNPKEHSVKMMKCPAFNATRYEHLRASKWDRQLRYFFALNLRQCEYILPRLLTSIVEAMRFLGPEGSALSVIEGHSDDGTAEVLAGLRKELAAVGVEYWYLRSDIDPNDGRRIEHLAELRNLALEPLVNSHRARSEKATAAGAGAEAAAGKNATSPLPGAGLDVSDDAHVIFLNDVAICPDDILELLHQRVVQAADMTCAMDWSHMKGHPTFYDQWVARQLNGDSFFDIPTDRVTWDLAEDLFFNDAAAMARFSAHRATQVFACWNGAVAFTAGPVMRGEVRFRSSLPGGRECVQGEPTLFCKDLWFRGRGRIAVVPTVNLEYDDEHGAWIKKTLGYAADLVGREDREEEPFEVPWRREPPEKVLCMPSWDKQTWVPWNEGLAEQ